jgi:hypothetical protein
MVDLTLQKIIIILNLTKFKFFENVKKSAYLYSSKKLDTLNSKLS